MVSRRFRTILVDLTADFKFNIKVFSVFKSQRLEVLFNLPRNLRLVFALQRQIRRHIKRQTLIVKAVLPNMIFVVYRTKSNQLVA